MELATVDSLFFMACLFHQHNEQVMTGSSASCGLAGTTPFPEPRYSTSSIISHRRRPYSKFSASKQVQVLIDRRAGMQAGCCCGAPNEQLFVDTKHNPFLIAFDSYNTNTKQKISVNEPL